jgi:hypothetical protein
MFQDIPKLLHRLSRECPPKQKVEIKGRLHDSSLGAIYLATFANQGGPNESKANETSLVLKTMDLQQQNVWCLVKDTKRTTLRGQDHARIVVMHDSKSDLKEHKRVWLDPFGTPSSLAKIAFVDGGKIQRDNASHLFLLNEYMNEALVGLLVHEYLDPVLPHYVSIYDAWIHNAFGFLLQDYGGQSCLKILSDMSLEEFKSLVLQVLVAIAFGQTILGLKHHDVHLENVFVTRLNAQGPLKQFPDATKCATWSYKLSKDIHFTFDHCHVLGRLGDFGLASANDPNSKIRFERVDYPLLDIGETEWGAWNGSMDSCASYDMMTFLSKFFLEHESAYIRSDQRAWAQEVYWSIHKFINEKSGVSVEMSWIGRPFRGHEGPVDALTILKEAPVFETYRNASKETAYVWDPMSSMK